jgi:hypothetical protein
MYTLASFCTGIVLTIKAAVVEPFGMMTLPSTVAAKGLSLFSEMTTPPDGASLPNVTVPLAVVPPITLEGFIVTDDTSATEVVCEVSVVTAVGVVEAVAVTA